MTSKNYLCKSIKENIRRNMFLTILISLALLVVFPVYCITSMEGAGHIEAYMGFDGYQRMLLRCIGPDSPASIVVVAAAVLYALLGFGYLYSGEKTDFYHSLPMKREALYLVSLVSSLISFVVPYLVSIGMAYMIGMVSGGNSPYVLKITMMTIGLHLLYFLVFYTGAVLAILLTGNLFTGALGFAGIMSYGLILDAAVTYMNDRFFHTLSARAPQFTSWFLSPVVVYVNSCIGGENLAEMWSGQGVLRGSGIVERYRMGMIYGVVMLVVLLGLNIWIYKIRPSESYHKAIAFPKLEPVIKVCSVIPISLLAGLVFSAGMKHVFLWMVVGTVVSALVLSAAFDFLYTLDIRSCIKPKVTDGIILAVLALVVTGYRMDITGVDSFLPDKDKIETMSVQLNSISDTFSYPEGYYGRDVLNEDRLESFDSVYQLAKTGVAYYKQNDGNEEGQIMVDVDVAFHMKSGKTVYRNYYIPETEEALKAIEEIYDDWDYREKIMPTYYATAEDIDFLYVIDHMGRRMQMNLQQDKLEILYKTYKNELESMTFSESSKQRVIGYISAEQKMQDSYTREDYMATWDLPVYEGFKETRVMLEELGCPISDTIPAEEVLRIRLTSSDEMGNTEGEVILEKKEDMERILEALSYGDGRYRVGSPMEYAVNVEITWNDRFKEQWRPLYLMNNGTVDDILKELHID
nr:DUF6449 domain-containing protein [uncultured Blautia sp.]